MALITCKNCGKEISSNAERCIHCNTLVEKEIRTKGVITDYETEDNIKKLNRLANVLNIILILAGIILFFVGMGFEDMSVVSFSLIFVIIGFVLPPFLKWKALVLKNLYEINRKVG